MLYLPIFILTTDGTIGCVMCGTWYQICVNTSQHWEGMMSCIKNLAPYCLAPSVTHCTANGAIETSKSFKIIRKAERQLLNEIVTLMGKRSFM